MSEELSRRSFLENAALLAGATAASVGAPAAAFADEADAEESQEEADFYERPDHGEGHPRRLGAPRSGAEPIEPVEPPDEWDEEADVVVVGTGWGGLTASLYLVQAGKSVITLEKSVITGGASRHAASQHCNMGGTKLHQAEGYAWPNETFDPTDESDVKEVSAAFLEHYNWSADSRLMMREVSEGPKWIDWMCEQDGIEWEVRPYYAYHPIGDAYLSKNGQNSVMGNSRSVDTITADLEEAGGIVETETECTALVAEDGEVLGVVAKHYGEEKYIKANTCVVLAAGGFGYNLDLLEQYIPSAYMYAVQGGPTTAHTGECTRMGLGMGADMAGYNSFDCWDGALDDYWGDGDGLYWHYMWRPMFVWANLPWLAIDKMGHRLPFYCGGSAGEWQPLFEGEPFCGGGEAIVPAYMGVGDHRKWLIWDSNWEQAFEQWEGTAFEGSHPSVIYDGLSEEAKAYVPESWTDDWDKCLENGSIKCADTLEELAELCGFDVDLFVGAVERWNADCEAGEDTELIVPMLPEWMTPVTEPPFYCGAFGGQIGKTFCGLRVTDKMEVVDVDQQIIPGLYAVWSTAGGFIGENILLNFGSSSPMGCSALSGTSGFIAARAILGEYDD